jgi:phosphoenolpyruvate---glycerone phosphotransferase subunit DhaK
MTELEKDSLLLRAVYLYYKEGVNIQTIADRLGVSRFRVSRYLKEAEEKGIVEIRINDANIHFERLALAIETQYDVHRIVIVPVSEDMGPGLSRRMVGGRGAEIIRGVTEEMSIGISWGRTIAYMVESMPANKFRAKQICELTGGLGVIQAGLPTTALASLFAQKLFAYCYQMQAPLIVSNAEIARQMLSDVTIQTTLEAGRLCDLALFGVASLWPDSMLHRSGLLTMDELESLSEQGAVGSILGRFLDADGHELKSEYSERSISISLSEFMKIPERVLLAGGEGKAEAVSAMLKSGLATTVVMDNQTAQKVYESG